MPMTAVRCMHMGASEIVAPIPPNNGHVKGGNDDNPTRIVGTSVSDKYMCIKIYIYHMYLQYREREMAILHILHDVADVLR